MLTVSGNSQYIKQFFKQADEYVTTSQQISEIRKQNQEFKASRYQQSKLDKFGREYKTEVPSAGRQYLYVTIKPEAIEINLFTLAQTINLRK